MTAITRTARTTALALLLAAPPALAQRPVRDTSAVPVYREPRHRPVFTNAIARVLDVRVPPGDTSGYHEHADRMVGVVISAARTWDQPWGKTRTPVDTSPRIIGAIFDNEAQRRPYTHRVANADTVPFRYVVGQQLASSGIASTPMPAGSGLVPAVETPAARSWRVTLAPGQATAEHVHAQPGLTVQVGAGAVRLEGTRPGATSATTGPGAWWWRDAGARHVLRNVGTQPVVLVEMDWK